MSTTQRPTRRLSARLHDRNDALGSSTAARANGEAKTIGSTTGPVQIQTERGGQGKKRKIDYDEEDDGFVFKRVKSKKPELKPVAEEEQTKRTQPKEPAPEPKEDAQPQRKEEEPKLQPKKRKIRLSFSTPNPKEQPPVRRSKRLSQDNEQQDGSPSRTIRTKEGTRPTEKGSEKPSEAEPTVQQKPVEKKPEPSPPKSQGVLHVEDPRGADTEKPAHVNEDIARERPAEQQKETIPTLDEDHSATKIALPFADTPVIKRNKAMREGKAGKGERRSSLGFRGRRASSLIESGISNALPHKEVGIPDFYKHIESEGLPEPRRMKQLLTWCATRALDEKPIGTDFEDSSARSAARVIQEELLKGLANESKLSDWFSREDALVQQKPLPERPNPKNVQNIEKIEELEEQIKRLRAEKEALGNLLATPAVPSSRQIQSSLLSNDKNLDQTLLSETDIAALDSLPRSVTSSDQISQRVNGLYDSLGPTIDKFADGIHTIGQYRQAADNVASRTLAICAERLSQREKEGRKRALPEAQGTPPKDLGGVLRSLSRADR
ncbi:hypothetical protein LTR93_002046 [Exophiala xenobiotica]|nr:hypothetical protein LTR93_002046 [Exophiala xenobiotica]